MNYIVMRLGWRNPCSKSLTLPRPLCDTRSVFLRDDKFSQQALNNYQARESMWVVAEGARRREGAAFVARGGEGRNGTAQVAARIDRPGCALQCCRWDQPTHLLAKHHRRSNRTIEADMLQRRRSPLVEQRGSRRSSGRRWCEPLLSRGTCRTLSAISATPAEEWRIWSSQSAYFFLRFEGTESGIWFFYLVIQLCCSVL